MGGHRGRDRGRAGRLEQWCGGHLARHHDRMILGGLRRLELQAQQP